MEKLKLLSLLMLLYSFTVNVNAQSVDCSGKISHYLPSRSFTVNESSKSAVCVTGKKYEFMLSLLKGKDYRISFFASPVFDRKINFRIIDVNSGKKVLDLPGETEDAKRGSCVLVEYYDKDRNAMVHPFFDFLSSAATTLKIIIDIAPKEQTNQTSSTSGGDIANVAKGCITVFIQDRVAQEDGFDKDKDGSEK